MPQTKGQRRATSRRAARKAINRSNDPGISVRRGYGGDVAVSFVDGDYGADDCYYGGYE